MDPSGNGSFRFPALVMQTALFAMSAGLLACAHPSADAQAPQQKAMQERPPTRDDIRAEQDRVAVLVDRAAVEAVGQAGDETPPAESAPLPQAPAVTADALEDGIVRLANALRGPAQTSPQFVGRALGIPLGPDKAGKRWGAQGRFGSGTYVIEVWAIYPGAPGRQVSVFLKSTDAQPCGLSSKHLAAELKKAGYEGQNLPRFMDPSISFSRNAGTATAFVELDVESHDAPRCVWQVTFALQAEDA